nr:FAD-dependent monooxygenase [Gammaproteobacteria bacterium]
MKNILISGAGIAGLSLARQFNKHGIKYTIIEKKSALDTLGTGIALPANAVRALRFMGLSSALNQMHQVKEIIYAGVSGRIISQASLLDAPLNKDKFVALQRSKLQDILQHDLNLKTNQTIYFDTSIIGMKQRDKGVDVICSNPDLNGHYDAVIGADGLYSTVRDLAFDAPPLVDLGVTNWRWVCDYSTRGIQPTYMLGRKNAFLAYPIGRHQIYCYAHQADLSNQYAEPNQADQHITQLFSDYDGIARPLLANLPDNKAIHTGRLRSVPSPLFSEADVALVGDASNACSPMLQQGAAAAFEDVIVLSELLAKFSVRDALLYYKKLRYQRVNWVVKTSDDGIKSFIKVNSRWSMMARNLLIKKNGPLNVLGWKHLLSTCPLDELTQFLQSTDISTVNMSEP